MYHAGQLRVIERRGSKKKEKVSRQYPFRLVPALIFAVVALGIYLASGFGSWETPEISIKQSAVKFQSSNIIWQADYQLSHRVSSGQALAGIFSSYGLALDDAQRVYQELKNKGAHNIRAGQLLDIGLSSDGEFSQLSTEIDSLRKIFVNKNKDGTFTSLIEELKKHSKERVVNGSIQSSFALAANERGLPYTAIDDLVDLFGDRISFHRDFRKNDEFSIVYRDTVLEDGTSLGFGTILAAALEVGGNIFCAVRYVGADGKARYFDQDGELLGAAFLRYPVKFSRISSSFSRSRFHPVLKRRRPHNGTDFAAPTGTPVRSVADGRVTFAARKGGNGNMVKIRHTNRYTTAYLHLHRIAKGIRRGSRVERGQVIGTVGMTGLATGPHLHYSFYDRGRYVDPLKVKLPKIEKLSRDQKIDPVYLNRVLYTLKHYRGRNIDIAEVEPIS